MVSIANPMDEEVSNAMMGDWKVAVPLLSAFAVRRLDELGLPENAKGRPVAEAYAAGAPTAAGQKNLVENRRGPGAGWPRAAAFSGYRPVTSSRSES
jgi:hypothetical protein